MEVRILNHIDRDCVDYAIRIESLGQSVEVNTDTTYYMKKRDDYRYTGINDNFFGIMRDFKWTSDRLIIMHDDLEFKDDTFDSIEHILKFAPDSPISFYAPTNNMFKDAYETNHVLKLFNGVWCQCVAYPKRYVDGILRWIDSNVVQYGKYAEDVFVEQYNCFMNEPFYAVMPSLVQHDGYDRSLHGNPSVCGQNKRNSFCYEDFDVKKIDWSKEFKKPKQVNNRYHKAEGLRENHDRA